LARSKVLREALARYPGTSSGLQHFHFAPPFLITISWVLNLPILPPLAQATNFQCTKCVKEADGVTPRATRVSESKEAPTQSFRGTCPATRLKPSSVAQPLAYISPLISPLPLSCHSLCSHPPSSLPLSLSPSLPLSFSPSPLASSTFSVYLDALGITENRVARAKAKELNREYSCDDPKLATPEWLASRCPPDAHCLNGCASMLTLQGESAVPCNSLAATAAASSPVWSKCARVLISTAACGEMHRAAKTRHHAIFPPTHLNHLAVWQ
jgi:hypothetical protein